MGEYEHIPQCGHVQKEKHLTPSLPHPLSLAVLLDLCHTHTNPPMSSAIKHGMTHFYNIN